LPLARLSFFGLLPAAPTVPISPEMRTATPIAARSFRV
jgi:hypothetical protein